jgi:hypothetical protein
MPLMPLSEQMRLREQMGLSPVLFSHKVAALERSHAKLLGALRNLCDKLDAIKKPVDDLTVFAYIHGYKYQGPSFVEEYDAARAAIAEAEGI